MNLLRRWESGPNIPVFSLHRPTMRLKTGNIWPRSPTSSLRSPITRQPPSGIEPRVICVLFSTCLTNRNILYPVVSKSTSQPTINFVRRMSGLARLSTDCSQDSRLTSTANTQYLVVDMPSGAYILKSHTDRDCPASLPDSVNHLNKRRPEEACPLRTQTPPPR